ncbi:MAG: DNA-directed RNA polymerase subunit omega [Candidatus Scalinduaceae bacterium]
MAYSLQKLSEIVGGTYVLTYLLIRRTRELINGAPKLIETNSEEPVKIAFEEFLSGKFPIPDKEIEKTEKNP